MIFLNTSNDVTTFLKTPQWLLFTLRLRVRFHSGLQNHLIPGPLFFSYLFCYLSLSLHSNHTGFFAVSQTFQQHSPLGHCPCCSLYLEHFCLNIHITHASLPLDHCSNTPYVQSMLKKDSAPHSGQDCTSHARPHCPSLTPNVWSIFSL